MDTRKYKFLVGILGVEGATALRRAGERSEEVENVLVPRSILAWLNSVESHEGEIPGIENTYVSFQKSEKKYSGSISLGEEVYEFQDVDTCHVASAVAVAIGVDGDRQHPNLKDLDLVRLGKSVDLLVRAHALSEQLSKNDDLAKAITKIPAGARIKTPGVAVDTYDYSHVLTPQHRSSGYSLQVRHSPHNENEASVSAILLRDGHRVGHVSGDHDSGALKIGVADLDEPHLGQGLGTSMYEALMAHAHHNGIREVRGSVHSTMASRVHAKLSQKHGMNYKATPTPFPRLADPVPGPYDSRVGPYKYTIKEEEPAHKAEPPGPAHAATEPRDQMGPAPAAMQQQRGPPKPPKPVLPKVAKSIKISKKESESSCSVCGLAQFTDARFTGCFCLKSLAKNTKTTATGSGYQLTLGQDWDKEAILTLMDALGAKDE